MANPDSIEFECPRCLNSIRVPGDQAGQRIDCPSCQGSLLVPQRSAGQDLFDDIFDSTSSSEPVIDSPASGKSKTNEVADEPEKSPEVELEPESDDDLLSGLAGPDDNPLLDDNPLVGKDPFEADPNAPLKIDGIGDLYEHGDVYGVKCKICDTRIHVRPDQANTYVECPECYSKVLVPPPEKKSKPTQRWVKENRAKSGQSGEDELKLSDPVQRPQIDIDQSFGLESPTEDLLAPKPKPDPMSPNPAGTVSSRDDAGLELIGDGDASELQSGSSQFAGQRPTRPPSSAPSGQPTSERKSRPTASKQKKSRRELYEEAQRKQQAEEAGVAYHPDDVDQVFDESDFPEFEFGSLASSAIEMLKSPGVLWRTALAIILMSVGTIAMQWFFPSSAPAVEEGEAGTMLERLAAWAAWGFVGGIPYVLGLLLLWLTSAYIFRDAALGHRQVRTFKNRGNAELTGTFLIFSFGFFIGGLPALFLTLAILPLRVLLGPLFLLGAWYSQSPFAIVNVDAFKHVSKNMGQWLEFYKFMLVLAAVGLIAGLIFWLRSVIPGSAFVLTMLVSVIGVILVAAITLVFAAVCGWHCGKVVEGLEQAEI